MLSLLLLVAGATTIAAEEDPRVTTEYGDVIGFRHGDSADVFLGIPFAAPPVGELRFQRPVAPSPWHDAARTTRAFSAACVPHVRDAVDAAFDVSEDCLYLNVIAPTRKEDDKSLKPVLFYVHGGGYEIGCAAKYGYKSFADIYAPVGIVVVTIQYRLGALGFASFGENSSLPGNYGLYDQAAALHFVHRNIERFGGDPSRITVWGISAGSASVNQLAISPITRDMIAGSIEISGTAYSSWARGQRVVKHSRELAEAAGCGGGRSTDVMHKCLERLSIDQLYEANDEIGSSDFSIDMIKFGPHLDRDFLPAPPEVLVQEAPRTPVLLGINAHESAFMAICNYAPTLHRMSIPREMQPDFGKEAFVEKITAFISEFLQQEELEDALEMIEKFYLSESTHDGHDAAFYLEKYSQFWSDLHFNVAARIRTEYQREQRGEVYIYYLEHYNAALFKKDAIFKGSMHINEMPYLMDYFGLGTFEWTPEEVAIRDKARSMIVTFVKNGTPTVPGLSWPSATQSREGDSTPFVKIGTSSWSIEDGFFDHAFKFWYEDMSRFSFDFITLSKRSHEKIKSEEGQSGHAEL